MNDERKEKLTEWGKKEFPTMVQAWVSYVKTYPVSHRTNELIIIDDFKKDILSGAISLND